VTSGNGPRADDAAPDQQFERNVGVSQPATRASIEKPISHLM